MKNNKLPTSPHLQIYKPQITSVLSITHRITGFCLSLTLPLYILWLSCIFFGSNSYSILIGLCSNIFVSILFILMTYGFSYHMLNGIRHLIWDFGYGLSIKFSSISGFIIIFLSILFTLLITLNFIL